MKIKLREIEKSERDILHNLFNFYLYDMSEYTGWSVGDNGRFEFAPSIIDSYFDKEDHYPYFIICDSEIAGFSLLRKYPADNSCYDIGQFFVLRKFKRKGVGEEAFRQSVTKYPGKWITRVLPDNQGAMTFWLDVISKATNGKFDVTVEMYNEKVEMNFIRYKVT